MRITVRGFVVLLLLYAMSESFLFFKAHINYYSVRNELTFLLDNPDAVTSEIIDENCERINKAIDLAPYNPLYLEARAQLFEWKALHDHNNSTRWYMSAKQDYLKSLAYRPLWAPTWINLAAVKWKLNEIDEEFENYLNLALVSGPQQAAVHSFIVEFALAQYKAKSPHYALVYRYLPKHLKLGLQHPLSEAKVKTSIDKFNASDLVCRILSGSAKRTMAKVKGCIK